jgi:hypothetical protein
MASYSLNDVNIAPPQNLNKIQKNKIKQLISANVNNPTNALALIKEYTKRINKIKILAVKFDNDDSPEGIEIITSNISYLFEFYKFRSKDGI